MGKIAERVEGTKPPARIKHLIIRTLFLIVVIPVWYLIYSIICIAIGSHPLQQTWFLLTSIILIAITIYKKDIGIVKKFVCLTAAIGSLVTAHYLLAVAYIFSTGGNLLLFLSGAFGAGLVIKIVAFCLSLYVLRLLHRKFKRK